MRKLFILTFSITTVLLTSISFAQDLNPTLSIRYEDFIENLTPGVAIGLKLNIDNERYTGWEVTTDQMEYLIDKKYVAGVFNIFKDNLQEEKPLRSFKKRSNDIFIYIGRKWR